MRVLAWIENGVVKCASSMCSECDKRDVHGCQEARLTVTSKAKSDADLPSIDRIAGICKGQRMYSRQEDKAYEQIGRLVEEWLTEAEARYRWWCETGRVDVADAERFLQELREIVNAGKNGKEVPANA